jgi:hypothetical protein
MGPALQHEGDLCGILFDQNLSTLLHVALVISMNSYESEFEHTSLHISLFIISRVIPYLF